MEEINLSNAILYADSARGVYIPQFFAESIKRECVRSISFWAWDGLEIDPYSVDSDLLHECWTHVLDNAVVIDPDTGIEYGLWQDGDLWLVPLADLYA